MQADYKHFISPEALKIQLNLFGWKLIDPIIHNGLAVFKPDFYDNRKVIAVSKRGYIYAIGNTLLSYKDKQYDSISILLEQEPTALDNFSEWKFIEEKEWVITKTGKEFLFSFSDLVKIPKNTKYRC